MGRGFLLVVVLGLLPARAAWPVSEAEAVVPPSAERLDGLITLASVQGWGPVESGAIEASLVAYGRNRTDAAEAWLLVARWARIFGANQREVVDRWISAVNDARLGHPNMATRYHPPDEALSALISADLGAWLLANRDFSRTFFEQLSPVDYLPAVLDILDRLHGADPRRFSRQAQLALAIALVYDVPPPPHWPHGQVEAGVLPRRLPTPEAAFVFWSEAEERGQTLQRLSRLSAAELKFMVDTSAPLPELEWARRSVRVPLTQLAVTYDSVQYRHDRMDRNVMSWPASSYALPIILREGGICVDQAYFASHAGKARGVPTLLFRGAGLDGRHAWFGYLDTGDRWQMDAGRHAEQRYVAGLAFDPQTWGDVSDHELSFLAEGFRRLPTYRQSMIHTWFAGELLRLGRVAEARESARRAVNHEARNLLGWETLLTALDREGADVRTREGTLREAAQALQRYPDLNATFLRRVAASLRARGQISAADNEERMLARKFQGGRTDLSVQQAAEMVTRAMETQPLGEQMRIYNLGLEQYGRGAQMEFFDKVVEPFVNHLIDRGHPAEARRAVERARELMEVVPGRQLERELNELTGRIR